MNTRNQNLVYIKMVWTVMCIFRSQLTNGMALTFQSSFVAKSSLKLMPSRSRPKAISNRSIASRSIPTMMPEGPEVRTLVDQLQPAVGMRLVGIQFLSGRYVNHGPPGGYDDFIQTMTRTRTQHNKENLRNNTDISSLSHDIDIITEWNAKGKFLWITLNDGKEALQHVHVGRGAGEDMGSDFKRSIWITLGMSGRFLHDGHPKIEKARWAMHLQNMETNTIRKIYYFDPRNFGTVKFCLSASELEKKLQSLGQDILKEEFTIERFLKIVESQRNPFINISKFLMDQKKLSGVGNYILAEGLYRANIDPFACLNELTVSQLRSLYNEIRNTALQSYASQGMTRSGGSYRDANGNKGNFAFELQCYGREISANGKPVIREINGPHKRTIWYTEDQLFVPRAMRDEKGLIIANNFNEKSKNENDIDLSSSLLEEGWKNALSSMLLSDHFIKLSTRLSKERFEGAEIYPPQQHIFSALNLCPLDKVKVVIVGQDPYHGPGQGHGLAFSVQKGVRIPPSLMNIFKEANEDVGIDIPVHGNLEYWAKQGVLLLNTVLTVRRGKANSHAKMGWEEFTDEIISIVNNQQEHVVFLLWGNNAAKKAANVDDSKHFIIHCSHPSPLGAAKTKTPFLGSKCFSRANTALEKFGKETIDWNVS